MNRRTVKRGANRHSDVVFIGGWFPMELVNLMDQYVRDEDTDRSKMLRKAVEEKLKTSSSPK